VSAAESPKIFITGKNGQVGRELVERATELGLEAISFGSEELDIRDRKAVIAAIDEHQPTVVINAAAYTAVDKAETEVDLAYAVNRDGVENLALACKAQNIPLIHISTDYVFDGEKESPYVESDVPNPVGVYGASKYAGEGFLAAMVIILLKQCCV
jgi:dTDP-4-dehydrorhamnose reductase